MHAMTKPWFECETADALFARAQEARPAARSAPAGKWAEQRAKREIERWIEEGRERGIKQGLEEGRAQARRLLVSQARHKFDDLVAMRLSGKLADVTDQDCLFDVAAWILECETADDLFARIEEAQRHLA